MKTIKQLRAKIAAMPRNDLEIIAQTLVVRLYGEVKGGRIVLNPDREWDGADVLAAISNDVLLANLNPDKL
jgi:hypothetical protein